MRTLEPAPATREDRLIWLNINIPLRIQHPLHRSPAYHRADRRDAEVMLKFAQTRVFNIADHLIRATYGLEYWDIEAIVSQWIDGGEVHFL